MRRPFKLETPPVVEVALGVGFETLPFWNITDPGEFRAYVKDGFPNVEYQPELMPMEVDSGPTPPQLLVHTAPEVGRVFYIGASGNELIQLQRDRLHVNWRKVQLEDEYPRYDALVPKMQSATMALADYAGKADAPLQISAAELSYVNQIAESELWSDFSDIRPVFGDWLRPSLSAVKVTGSDAGIRAWNPDGSVRFECSLKMGLRALDGKKIMILSLTAKGKVENMEEFWTWTEKARQVVGDTFLEITTPQAHEFWGLKYE